MNTALLTRTAPVKTEVEFDGHVDDTLLVALAAATKTPTVKAPRPREGSNRAWSMGGRID